MMKTAMLKKPSHALTELCLTDEEDDWFLLLGGRMFHFYGLFGWYC